MCSPRSVVTIIPRSGEGRQSPRADLRRLKTSGILRSPITSKTSTKPAPSVTRRWISRSRCSCLAAATASRRAASAGDLATARAPRCPKLKKLSEPQQFGSILRGEFGCGPCERLHVFRQRLRFGNAGKRFDRLAIYICEPSKLDCVYLPATVL